MVETVPAKNDFQARLNELFANAGRRLKNNEVADALRARGLSISNPYLSQLRSGVRAHPSSEIVTALADFFEVSPDYFFFSSPTGGEANTCIEDAAVVDRLDDATMRRMLTHAIGLSPRGLELLADAATKFRIADRCPAVLADALV